MASRSIDSEAFLLNWDYVIAAYRKQAQKGRYSEAIFMQGLA
jgi:hypothetical protein